MQKWFDVAVALARVQADLGIIPHAAAVEIAARARVENIDLQTVAAGMAKTRHSMVPALRALQTCCDPALGEFIHLGPTTPRSGVPSLHARAGKRPDPGAMLAAGPAGGQRAEQTKALLHPTTYVGESVSLVEGALAAARQAGWLDG